MPRQQTTPHIREFGAWVKEARTRKGWTMDDLEERSAEEFGEEGRIKQSWLSNLERGKLDTLTFDRGVRLGQLLGIDPDELARMMQLMRGRPMTEAEQAERSKPPQFTELAVIYANPKVSDESRERVRLTLELAAAALRAEADLV